MSNRYKFIVEFEFSGDYSVEKHLKHYDKVIKKGERYGGHAGGGTGKYKYISATSVKDNDILARAVRALELLEEG